MSANCWEPQLLRNSLRFKQRRVYRGSAPSLPAGPATCPRHENGWEHMHSVTPASPPALCLHNTVCKTRTRKHMRLHNYANQDKGVIVNKQTINLTCMSWDGTSCLESCEGLWTGWHCGEPSQLSAASPKEPAHQNIKVLFLTWTVTTCKK